MRYTFFVSLLVHVVALWLLAHGAIGSAGDAELEQVGGMNAAPISGGPEAREDDPLPPDPQEQVREGDAEPKLPDPTAQRDEMEIPQFPGEDVRTEGQYDIPEGIVDDFKFLEVASLGAVEPFDAGPQQPGQGLTVDEVRRIFAYVIMNYLEDILAVTTENVSDALLEMGDILGTSIAKAYPELGGKPEMRGAACAAFLASRLDGIISEAYERQCRTVVAEPLADRLAGQLAKTLSLSVRKKVLALFKPDLPTYVMRGVNKKLGNPVELVGNRARAHKALAACIEQYGIGKAHTNAEKALAEVARKALAENLHRLLEKAMKDALLEDLLEAAIDEILDEVAAGGDPQSAPIDSVPPSEDVPVALPFKGTDKKLEPKAVKTVRVDRNMRTVRRLIEIRTGTQSEKVAKLREKPARPVIAGRARVRQKGALSLGSAFALTPSPITREKVVTARYVEPVLPELTSVRFGRAIRRTTPIKIDGNLNDWKRAYPLVPRNSRMFRDFRAVMYMQWDPQNVYLCGEVRLDHDRVTMRDRTQFWLDDCLEFWIDSKNTKLLMDFPPENHHFVFCPPDKKPDSLGQIKYGDKAKLGVPEKSVWYDKGQLGIEWATKSRKGYFSFEVRLPRGTELREFEPYAGNYIGFNYIASSGVEHRLYWASDKFWDVDNRSTYVWSNPHIWGGVELVGIEAEVRGVGGNFRHTRAYLDLGRPMYIRIKDADMNLDDAKREFVNAMVTVAPGDDAEPMTLYESSPSSGVFIGSIATAHLIDSSEAVRGDGTLHAREGQEVEVAYTDISRESGQRNVPVVEKLPIIIPVALIRSE
ncbi:MAG: sugar-binding protein [Planctomycetia bacterium]|nr:sugar-binding protein [Planctomycetia bacterium]